MPFPTVGIAITLAPATGSAAFETKRLIVLHDRPIWLGRAENSDNRTATTTNGWFYSTLLDDKMAMLYLFRNEIWIANLHPHDITMVNTIKLSRPEVLGVGDVIRLGVPSDRNIVAPTEPKPIHAEVTEITSL
jgi:hypothetical protein